MWRAVARSPLWGKVLARFRYHRHFFKYIVCYPYGDDATLFRTLREHHVRSTWVPKLALIITLFILSSRQESSLAFANPPTNPILKGEPHGHQTGYAARIYPGIRSLALACLGGLSTESRRSQGARHFTQEVEKPSHKQYFRVRARAPSHRRITLQDLVW